MESEVKTGMEAIGAIKSNENQQAIASHEQVKTASGPKNERTEAKRQPLVGDPGKRQVQANEETTKRVAEAMDQYVRSIQSDLEIKIHAETGKIVVKVISHETGEVIREIPPEEMLKLAEKMEEMAGGLLRTTA